MPKSTIGYYTHAEDYINEENYDDANILKVWTDGYCENNGKKNALASIGVFFDDDDPRNLSERLPGSYQTTTEQNCIWLFAL
ncbi:ribonuclease HI protein [Gigaspora margarita]|uniref:Ribonuclease HI protein n=1 Tax=Gigaspora margarita TaxID=4874 RepID=A0A8H3XLQ6_GIGMA|nr:ribonuclease HI protein [Gigaspora margarita]